MCEFCRKADVAKRMQLVANKKDEFYNGYDIKTGPYTALVLNYSTREKYFYIYASGEGETDELTIFYCPVCGKHLNDD